MMDAMLDRIETHPNIMTGKPVIRGTRLTVELILEKLADGETYQELMRDYPILGEDDIRAALLYAARTISLEEVVRAG